MVEYYEIFKNVLFIEIKISKLMNYWTMVIGYGLMLTP